MRSALAVAGVAAAMALVVVQWGLLSGFRASASDLIHRFGDDAWLVSRGRRTLEDGDLLPAGALERVAEEPCVRDLRPLVLDYHQRRHDDGHLETVLLVGRYEASVPGHGSGAADLADDEVAHDESDDYVRPDVELRGGIRAPVVATTRGLRHPSQAPYLFATQPTALRWLGLPFGVAHLASLHADAACLARVRDLHVADTELLTTEELARRAETHWLDETGVGHVLRFGLGLALAIASAVFAQVLLSHVRAHRSELAALRAAGASRFELLGFVAWQAAMLTVVGGTLGLALGALLASRSALPIRIDPDAIVRAVALLTLASVAAFAAAARYVRNVRPEEVLR